VIFDDQDSGLPNAIFTPQCFALDLPVGRKVSLRAIFIHDRPMASSRRQYPSCQAFCLSGKWRLRGEISTIRVGEGEGQFRGSTRSDGKLHQTREIPDAQLCIGGFGTSPPSWAKYTGSRTARSICLDH
jgi:hypothetical protein